MKRFSPILGIAFILVAPAAWAGQDVVNTRHNLSSTPAVGVTRTFASATTDEICVFCHTPHNALPAAPLWNHLPTAVASYTPYSSSTLKTTTVGQPTGKSRICLACHDGTIALGALQNPPAGNDLAATLLTGRADLTTDLSNDHPISFAYDAALLGLNPELADPAGIGLPLEGDQLQCTTCHDPHEKDVVPFLRQTTLDGTLCTTCHVRADAWPTSTHATSTATVAATDLDNRRPEWVAGTVAGNACLSCHTPHNAVNAERLIAKDGENTCYGCHDGTPASNIQAEFAKLGGIHPVADLQYAGIHDATKVENPASMPLHVECMDCHNPHTVTPGALPMISFNPADTGAPHTNAPAANALIQGVTGIDLNGNATASVTNQYELCFKCHGRIGQNTCGADRCGAPKTHGMIRADMISGPPDLGGIQVDRSIRDRVIETAGPLSWHPIESNNAANNAEVPSLRSDIPLNTSTSRIYCTDCHNSNLSEASGGTGPNGPHGSTEEGLLAQGYVLDINSAASDTASYALCYKCHDELTIRSSASFNKHDAHLGNRQGSCMKCHDPHGSHAFPRLINFLWWSDDQIVVDCIRQNGGGIQPCDTSDTGGVAAPFWQDDGNFTGRCWLSCHGTGHSGRTY